MKLNNIKTIGIIGDINDEISKSINQEFSPKYKIYRYSYGGNTELIFQSNDKELFIKELVKAYNSVGCIDGIGISFTINNMETIGAYFNNEELIRKYIEQNEK
jgi:hypothetical protein